MADIDFEKLRNAVRELSLSVRDQMKDRGGYRVRLGDGELFGKIAVGLGNPADSSFFPENYQGFEVIILPLDLIR